MVYHQGWSACLSHKVYTRIRFSLLHLSIQTRQLSLKFHRIRFLEISAFSRETIVCIEFLFFSSFEKGEEDIPPKKESNAYTGWVHVVVLGCVTTNKEPLVVDSTDVVLSSIGQRNCLFILPIRAQSLWKQVVFSLVNICRETSLEKDADVDIYM